MIRTLHSRITILISGYIYTSMIDSNLCQLYAVSLILFSNTTTHPFPTLYTYARNDPRSPHVLFSVCFPPLGFSGLRRGMGKKHRVFFCLGSGRLGGL